MTGARAIITGKPSLHALRFIARHLGVKTTEVGVVGDDPVVEMQMARDGKATGFGVCNRHHQPCAVEAAAAAPPGRIM